MTGRISIPQAPLRGGGIAQAPAPIDDGVGRAVAQLGEDLHQVGKTLENDRLSRDLGRARVDIANGLSAARLDMERETDPDAIDTGWRDRVTAMRAEALARVDPLNAEAAGLAFDELAGRHGVAVGSRAIQLKQEQSKGLLVAHENALAASPGIGDLAERDVLAAQFAEQVMDAVEAGALTEAEAQRSIWRQRQGLAEQAAITLLGDDPAGLLSAIDDGQFPDMDGADRARYRNAASAEVQRREAGATREAARLADEQTRALSRQLDTLSALAQGGRSMKGEQAFLADPAVQALPGFAEASAMVELRDALPGFAALPPGAQIAQIRDEQAKPLAERFEARKLDAMEAVYAAAAKAWRSDPIAQAQALDLGAPPALPQDLSDPGAWTAAFQSRVDYGQSLVDQGYIDQPAFFTAAERAQLGALVAPGQDARARAMMAATLAEGFGQNAPRAMAGITEDPVFRHVGGMLAAGGRGDVALRAFEGQTAIDAGTVALPGDAARQAILFEAAGTVLADAFPDAAGPQAEILKTADALYAARAAGVSAKDDPDRAAELWADALQTAMGGQPGPHGEPLGGVRDINGRPTWLPLGVAADEVENTLDAATELLSTDQTGAGPAARNVFAAASQSGGDPMFGGEPLNARVARRVELVAVADGVYRLTVKVGRNDWKDVTDSTDPTGLFLLSWPKLRAAVDKAERAR